jgi:hypothetical protein
MLSKADLKKHCRAIAMSAPKDADIVDPVLLDVLNSHRAIKHHGLKIDKVQMKFGRFEPEVKFWFEDHWHSISYNKALSWPTPKSIVNDAICYAVEPFITRYAKEHLKCETCGASSSEVHHPYERARYLDEKLTPELEAFVEKDYLDGFLVNERWVWDHPIVHDWVKMHDEPGFVVALCKRCHNTAHGKETRQC